MSSAARRQRPAFVAAAYLAVALTWLGLSGATAGALADAVGTSPWTVLVASTVALLVASTVVVWRVTARGASQPGVEAAPPDEVERLRRMFLGAVSHELRTPVTSMVGYAETLREHHRTLSSSQIAQFTERLLANGHRLERLILDLLELHPTPLLQSAATGSVVDLDELLTDQVESQLDGVHVIQLRTSVGQVVLDEHKTRRIVAELLDNVIRHTPPTTRVSVSATHHQGTVMLVIEDDGPGVDPRIAAAATEPFVQGHHVADAATPGLGIGLALASRYADLHGGRLDLSRSTSGGTRAVVTLPTLGPGTAHEAA